MDNDWMKEKNHKNYDGQQVNEFVTWKSCADIKWSQLKITQARPITHSTYRKFEKEEKKNNQPIEQKSMNKDA